MFDFMPSWGYIHLLVLALSNTLAWTQPVVVLEMLERVGKHLFYLLNVASLLLPRKGERERGKTRRQNTLHQTNWEEINITCGK